MTSVQMLCRFSCHYLTKYNRSQCTDCGRKNCRCYNCRRIHTAVLAAVCYHVHGYQLWVDSVLFVDKFNPQVAARLARALENWRRYEPTLSNLMYKALKYVSEEKNLSPNVREIIEHALTEPV